MNYSVPLQHKNEDNLRIYTLGRFVVCLGKQQLSFDYCRSRKLWNLLMYLLTQQEKPLTPDNIVETLWPDQYSGDPKNVVKNLVHRLRCLIEPAGIGTADSLIKNLHGCYSLNPDFPYWMDAEEFENLCRQARELEVKDISLACHKYRQALELYNGEYLPENPYSDWLVPARHYYRQLFIDSASRLLAIYKMYKQYRMMILECERILSIEHLEENIHISYIEAMLGEGNISRARDHYEYLTSLLYKEFGVKPSRSLRKLYHQILNHPQVFENGSNNTIESCNNQNGQEGAVICDTETFSALCDFEKRKAGRSAKPIHVGSFKINVDGQHLACPSVLKGATTKLVGLLKDNLRNSDAISIIDEKQCAVLLSDADQPQAEEVFKRAALGFKKIYPGNEVVSQYTIQPLLSSEEV